MCYKMTYLHLFRHLSPDGHLAALPSIINKLLSFLQKAIRLILIKISPIYNCPHKSSLEPFKEPHPLISFPHPLHTIVPSIFCGLGLQIFKAAKNKVTLATIRVWQNTHGPCYGLMCHAHLQTVDQSHVVFLNYEYCMVGNGHVTARVDSTDTRSD